MWMGKSRRGAFLTEKRTLAEVLQYLLDAAGYTMIAVRPQRRDLPDPADLIAYVEDRLDERRRKAIERRIAASPELQAEVDLLRRVRNPP
jgi:hypothetical protein